MKNKNVVAKNNLHYFPFNYRKLKIVKTEDARDNPFKEKTARTAIIQNDNTRLDGFYKNISLII